MAPTKSATSHKKVRKKVDAKAYLLRQNQIETRPYTVRISEELSEQLRSLNARAKELNVTINTADAVRDFLQEFVRETSLALDDIEREPLKNRLKNVNAKRADRR